MRSSALLLLVTGFATLMEAVVLPREERSLKCKEEGRFPDPSDCGSYIECISSDDGFLPVRRSCFGKAFNPKTLTCTQPSKVNGCHIRKGRHQQFGSSRFEDLCRNSSVDFTCGNCETQVMCSDGVAFETKCETGLRCTKNASPFGGGVCHIKHDDHCMCTEPNSYHQDPYFNSSFFLCKDDSAPIFYNCQKGMYFDEKSKTCLNEDGSPSCTQRGIFVYPNNCAKYYMCTYAVEGWIQTKLQCQTNYLFNEVTEKCEDPCKWTQKDFECQEEGRFRNPKDCSQFFECILDSAGNFMKMMRACPPSFIWNDETKRCSLQSEHECQVQIQGPVQQCKEEYEAICKSTGSPDDLNSENESETGGNEIEDNESLGPDEDTIESDASSSDGGTESENEDSNVAAEEETGAETSSSNGQTDNDESNNAESENSDTNGQTEPENQDSTNAEGVPTEGESSSSSDGETEPENQEFDNELDQQAGADGSSSTDGDSANDPTDENETESEPQINQPTEENTDEAENPTPSQVILEPSITQTPSPPTPDDTTSVPVIVETATFLR